MASTAKEVSSECTQDPAARLESGMVRRVSNFCSLWVALCPYKRTLGRSAVGTDAPHQEFIVAGTGSRGM